MEWFHQGLTNNCLPAAPDTLNSSQSLQRACLQRIDNTMHAQVANIHCHNVLNGTTGTLLEIPVDDHRVAAVAGHEIAHCIMRHISEARGRSLISELCRFTARSLRLNTLSYCTHIRAHRVCVFTIFTFCRCITHAFLILVSHLCAVSPFYPSCNFLFIRAATSGLIFYLNGSVMKLDKKRRHT